MTQDPMLPDPGREIRPLDVSTKAVEIDSNNANHVSICRGKVATTYYSQEQTNGATPFKKVKSPVYLAGDRAEIEHVRRATGAAHENDRAAIQGHGRTGIAVAVPCASLPS